MNAEPVFFLVDFDNHWSYLRDVGGREPSAEDVMDYVRDHIAEVAPLWDCGECRLRLYGGWSLPDGRPSPRASLLTACVESYRDRKKQVRFVPEIAHRLLGLSEKILGTYRENKGSAVGWQKLVDTMLSVDTARVAREGYDVVVFSDDTDFIPALYAAKMDHSTSVAWLRRPGEEMYDAFLRTAGVKVVNVKAK